MGVETAIAASAAASQVVGSGLQYFENKAAQSRAKKLSAQASSITGAPLPGTINPGQDSFLQYLRADPTALQPFQFNSSQAFKDLSANDAANIGDQAAALSAGAGSLGARFGTGFASKDALLRSRFAGDVAARNAGIAQSGFNTALATGMQSFQNQQQLYQQNVLNTLAQRGQQLQALGFGSSIPGTGAGGLVSGTGSDISQLLLLLQYLGKGSGGGSSSLGGSKIPAPTTTIYTPPIVNG